MNIEKDHVYKIKNNDNCFLVVKALTSKLSTTYDEKGFKTDPFYFSGRILDTSKSGSTKNITGNLWWTWEKGETIRGLSCDMKWEEICIDYSTNSLIKLKDMLEGKVCNCNHCSGSNLP